MTELAYRAVFLRIHPTGKMVLSLTTEADGKEAEYARLVADELGVPELDVKVVPRRRAAAPWRGSSRSWRRSRRACRPTAR